MTDPPAVAAGPERARILRFDVVERVVHWVTAALLAILVVTAIPLYFGSLLGAVLDRRAVELVHLWSGLALLVPLCVALAGPWGARTRRDVRVFARWRPAEVRWLRTLGRARYATGKFNPGQKLNAVVSAGLLVVLLGSGSMLQWFSAFPVGMRTAATFVHDLSALLIVLIVAGHVVVALAHPAALRAMVTGRVSARWAAEHAPAWLDDEGTPPRPR